MFIDGPGASFRCLANNNMSLQWNRHRSPERFDDDDEISVELAVEIH